MSSAPRVLRHLLTPLWIAFTVLVIAVAAGCLALGWWQWSRFEGLGGTFQNLGYTIQWPFFAAFAVYLWWRLLKDATTPADRPDDSSPVDAPHVDDDALFSVRQKAAEGASSTASVVATTRTLDDEDDPELAAYNRYLAGLDARAQTQVKERA